MSAEGRSSRKRYVLALLASVLVAFAGDARSEDHRELVIDKDERTGPDAALSISSRFAYDRSAFFIDDYRDYFPSAVVLRFSAAFPLGAGLRGETKIEGESARDAGAKAWNRVDWLNGRLISVGAALVWNGTGVLAPDSGTVIRSVEVRLSAVHSWLAFPSDAWPARERRPSQDLHVAGALEFLLVKDRPDTNRWNPIRAVRDVWEVTGGAGFRYRKSDPRLSGDQGYYLLEGDVLAACDPVFPIDPAMSAGPAAWASWSRDLGENAWNRVDWLNHLTGGVGLRAVYEPTSSAVGSRPRVRRIRFVFRTGYVWRTHWNHASYVPGFRPRDTIVAEISGTVGFGLRRHGR